MSELIIRREQRTAWRARHVAGPPVLAIRQVRERERHRPRILTPADQGIPAGVAGELVGVGGICPTAAAMRDPHFGIPLAGRCIAHEQVAVALGGVAQDLALVFRLEAIFDDFGLHQAHAAAHIPVCDQLAPRVRHL